MQPRHMLADSIHRIPAEILIENVEESRYGFEPCISLVLVLRGEISLTAEGVKNCLREKDVILINPDTLYTVSGTKSSQLLFLKLKPAYFEDAYEGFGRMKFRLNATDSGQKQKSSCEEISRLLLRLLQVMSRRSAGYHLMGELIVLEIVAILIQSFSELGQSYAFPASTSTSASVTTQEEERIQSIVQYIFTHYREKISLADLAEYLNLNPQYISRYVSKHMGSSLSTFITSVRLQESMKQLEDLDNKITYVALESGFPNLKSYFKAFREAYHMTPAKYRSHIAKESLADRFLGAFQEDFAIRQSGLVDDTEFRLLPTNRRDLTMDCHQAGQPMKFSWKKIMAFGRAAEGMREELRNQLRTIQKDIPFEYVRFHGILSDEMMVYSEDSKGNAEYNFSSVDELLDFLLDLKLKPFMELGFMPEQLAEDKKYMFQWKANISFPKSMMKWNELIRHFVLHLVERYGVGEVKSWYFHPFYHAYLSENQMQDYYRFIQETCRTIKSVDRSFKTGCLVQPENLENFGAFARAKGFRPDFLTFTVFGLTPSKEFAQNITENYEKVSRSGENLYIPQNTIQYCSYSEIDFLEKSIEVYHSGLKSYAAGTELIVSEWNISPNPKDLLHDTCYKAAFIVKQVLNSHQRVDGLVYWSISDIFEEVTTNNSVFHGGVGIITSNGIKKPAYFAYQLLNRLGETRISSGEGYFITRKEHDHSVQILLYHYCHFRSDRSACVRDPGSDPYELFDEKLEEFCLTLSRFSGKYIERKYRINRENGSAYDEWNKIGAPRVLSAEELKFMKGKSIYGYHHSEVESEGDIVIHEILKPHEVLLIELIPVLS